MKAFWTVLAAASLLWACADADEVNAAFRAHQVHWFTFDAEAVDGLRPLAGFDQSQRVAWVPRDQGVFATDAVTVQPGVGALAVSHLGLLVLSDPSGGLSVARPTSRLDLTKYRTGPLFVSRGRLFVTLTPGDEATPAATLAWWTPAQPRLAVYPIPSQVRDPSRRAIAFVHFAPENPSVGFRWSVFREGRWEHDQTRLTLDDGLEAPLDRWPVPAMALTDAGLAVQAKLVQTVGAQVPVMNVAGDGPSAAFTAGGWVAVAQDDRVRTFRLPDLGMAGRYTGGLWLAKGWVFTWELSHRAYAGAAGLVYIPRPVLAP